MARLNVQGLARRDEGLMRCIGPEPGMTVVSADLGSGEPTCTAHYSTDQNYYDATFGMVGKAPYYTPQGVLKIGDIYLTTMSVSPIGRDTMRQAFNERYGGLTFAEKWLEDEEFFTKKLLKKERQLHKILALGLSYSMGPKKLVAQARNSGHALPYKTAKEFFTAYWTLFKDVKVLGERLQALFKRQGYLVNQFGYRLVPDADYKCLNYFIQSSVSGIMHVLCEKFFALAPWCRFITVIHDEIVFECPTDRLKEAKVLMQDAEKSLNEDLGWTVQVRVGWAEGRDWFEAK
jgi:hypothetical protein